eukprot:TRINITY_DN39250_c0_g2_i1.p1 TRINITY_DN39250_c0_g2~~TRINITY_DN39250_c0_g2_i1.p1  ORF type:complete len:279 (-),score=82.13 TRINITY_DN39250_c0_g2_i1:149-961(-)
MKAMGLAGAHLGFVLFLGGSAAEAVTLTERTFGRQTDGKTVLINFHTNWCQHCQALKPTWNKLASGKFPFKDKGLKDDLLIADIDCSEGETRDFCVHEHGVDKFPWIKFGHPEDLDEYKGKKELKNLEEFVVNKLTAECTMRNQKHCSEDQVKLIMQFLTMDIPDLEARIEELAKKKKELETEFRMFKDNLLGTLAKAGQQKDADKAATSDKAEKDKIEANFKTYVDGLTSQHDSKDAETKAALAELKQRGLGLAREVLKNRKPKRAGEL